MIRYTPQQGIPYIRPGDVNRPCELAEVIQAQANAANARGASFATQASKVKAPTIVKISTTGVPAGGSTKFTTIDVNQGTPTDLTVFNGLLLNPGIWFVGLNLTHDPGTAGTTLTPTIGSIGNGSITEYIRDAGNTLPTLTNIGWPRQSANPADIIIATTEKFPVSGSWTSFAPVFHAQLWAVQVGGL